MDGQDQDQLQARRTTSPRSADESSVTEQDVQARLLAQKINDVKLERNRMLISLSANSTLHLQLHFPRVHFQLVCL